MTTTPAPNQAPSPEVGLLDRIAEFLKTPEGKTLLGLGALGLLAMSASAISAASERERRARARFSTPRYIMTSAAEQLDINRRNGKRFEDRVRDVLEDAFPQATVVPQVPVVTPEGKRRRMDFAVVHPNGSVTPAEAKNVAELRDEHVRQAEDSRAGLKNTHAVRSGLPILAVPTRAVVSDDLLARVRVVRVPTRRSR